MKISVRNGVVPKSSPRNGRFRGWLAGRDRRGDGVGDEGEDFGAERFRNVVFSHGWSGSGMGNLAVDGVLNWWMGSRGGGGMM